MSRVCKELFLAFTQSVAVQAGFHGAMTVLGIRSDNVQSYAEVCVRAEDWVCG
jgi:hypothetical protein